MSPTWRDEYRRLPDPPLWRSVLAMVTLVVVLLWPWLRGGFVEIVPAVLAGLAALVVLHDLVGAVLVLARRRRAGIERHTTAPRS